jgi:hypothetical protein
LDDVSPSEHCCHRPSARVKPEPPDVLRPRDFWMRNRSLE